MIRTTVQHGDKTYFVSTINRSCSFYEGYSVYAETMVWEYNVHEHKTVGGYLISATDSENSIAVHQTIVKNIHRYGIERDGDWHEFK